MDHEDRTFEHLAIDGLNFDDVVEVVGPQHVAPICRNLSNAKKAHVKVCRAVDQIVRNVLKLDQMLMQNDWYERVGVYRYRFKKAVVNLIRVNQHRSDEIDRADERRESIRWYTLAKRFIEMYTPLQDLSKVLNRDLMPHFAPEAHYRHAIWLRQKRVPEALIREIFAFAGINSLVHAASRAVSDGYKVVRKIPSYHPVIAYDRYILRIYRDEFHTWSTFSHINH